MEKKIDLKSAGLIALAGSALGALTYALINKKYPKNAIFIAIGTGIVGSVGGYFLHKQYVLKKDKTATDSSGNAPVSSARKANEDYMIAETLKSDPKADGEAIRKGLSIINDKDLDVTVKVGKAQKDPVLNEKLKSAKTKDEKMAMVTKSIGVTEADIKTAEENFMKMMFGADLTMKLK